MRSLVLLQSTRVTDGRTDRRTDRQNYDSQDRPRICSRGKNTRKHIQRRTDICMFRFLIWYPKLHDWKGMYYVDWKY